MTARQNWCRISGAERSDRLQQAGEAANLAKKIIRTRAGVRGNSGTKEQYEAELAKELADIVLYCDLTATKLGIDLWSTDGAVAKKFNEVSDKIGSELKL